MVKASELLEDFSMLSGQDDDETEESIIMMYIAVRLKPLVIKKKITYTDLNNMATTIADHYFDKSLSLDLIINSIYNYINSHNTQPPDELLSDNIEILLENYLEENDEKSTS